MVFIKNVLVETSLLAAYSNRGAVRFFLKVGYLLAAIVLNGYLVWTTKHTLAALWISLTLWLTIMVASASMALLSLGERR